MTTQVRVALLIGAALLAFFSIKVIRLALHPDLRKIPGPFLNRFTNIPLKLQVLSGQRTKYIHRLHNLYGPYVLVAPTEISVSDINGWREIHRIGSEFIKAPWYQQQSPVQYSDATCGVFGLRDRKVATARRKLFQQAGTKTAVSAWEPIIKELASRTVDKIRRDAQLEGKANVAKWWSLMTSDVLSSIAFGERFGMIEKEEKSQLIHDIEQAMIFIGVRMELPWLWAVIQHIPLPKIGRPNDLFTRFAAYGKKAVENTHAAWNKGSEMKTLFSKMVPEEDWTQQVPDSIVEMEAANIIIAGSDTTSVALTYLVYEVLSNPDVKTKLLAELDSCSKDPTWEELEQKPYLNHVIQETLRLHAPVPASLPRVAPLGAMLGGYKIPDFVVVDTQAYTFHRDPEVFPEPEKFNPDRWAHPTVEMKEYWHAFGGNARTCIGQNVARCELLHSTSRFFKECPDAILAPGTNEKSMDFIDFFVIKPISGKCEIVLADAALT